MEKELKDLIKKTDKKDRYISVRMTSVERMVIKENAEKSGRTMSRYMVDCAMKREIKLITAEDKKAYQELANYKANFNRISNLIKDKKEIVQEIETLVKSIEKTMKKIW